MRDKCEFCEHPYCVKTTKFEKRKAKSGEWIKVLSNGEITQVRWDFLGGVHVNDRHFTSYLDDEYEVLINNDLE